MRCNRCLYCVCLRPTDRRPCPARQSSPSNPCRATHRQRQCTSRSPATARSWKMLKAKCAQNHILSPRCRPKSLKTLRGPKEHPRSPRARRRWRPRAADRHPGSNVRDLEQQSVVAKTPPQFRGWALIGISIELPKGVEQVVNLILQRQLREYADGARLAQIAAPDPARLSVADMGGGAAGGGDAAGAGIASGGVDAANFCRLRRPGSGRRGTHGFTAGRTGTGA